MVLDRQRREARPTAILIVLALMFLVPMGACGTVGAMKLDTALSPIVSVASPGALDTIRPGTYVAVDVEPPPAIFVACPLASPPLAWDSSMVSGAERVLVASRTPIAAQGAHVVGQLCDASSPITCELPDGMREGLRRNAGFPGAPTLVLVSGSVPSDMLWEAFVLLGLAATCLLSFLFAAVGLVRAAHEPGRVALVRTLTIARSTEEIRAALRAEASPLRRIAEDSAARICFLFGTPVARVHVVGFHGVEQQPLRIDVELQGGAPYRGTTARLTVRELFPAQPHLVEGFPASNGLAVERAAAWVLQFADDMGARPPAS